MCKRFTIIQKIILTNAFLGYKILLIDEFNTNYIGEQYEGCIT